MINNCSLCNKIWDSEQDYQDNFEHRYDETYVIVMEDEEPWLYVPCTDWYYSDTVMQINFCPKCGRLINPKYKAMR